MLTGRLTIFSLVLLTVSWALTGVTSSPRFPTLEADVNSSQHAPTFEADMNSSLRVPTIEGDVSRPGVPTFEADVAVNNWNQFITNLDRAQEFLLNVWKGAYGSVSIFWIIWSWWLVAGGFYYSFANSYLGAKDEAEADWKENDIETRARFLNQIDLNSLFSNLRSLQEKVTDRLGEACYQRGLCEMRSFFATTPFFNMIPKTMRKMLRLEPQNRQDGTCGEIYTSCTLQNLLLSLLQGYFPGTVG